MIGFLKTLKDKKYQFNIIGYKKTIIKTIIITYLKEFVKIKNQVKSRVCQSELNRIWQDCQCISTGFLQKSDTSGMW